MIGLYVCVLHHAADVICVSSSSYSGRESVSSQHVRGQQLYIPLSAASDR